MTTLLTCHRPLLPVSSHFAIAHTRSPFGDRAGHCILRALFPSLDGGWRSACVISAAIALNLNVFVLIAQLFQKVPSLNTLATQSEPPFPATQLIVMVIFIALSVFALKGFHRQRPPDSFTPHPLFEEEQ